MKRFLLSLFVYALLFEAVPAQIVVNLNPVQDNSIYAANFGNSNGLGRLFSGVQALAYQIGRCCNSI